METSLNINTASAKAVVVIPSNREDNILNWFRKWDGELNSQHIIVIEDGPQKSFKLPRRNNISHYSWKEIDEELGDKSFIIPRKTDCIRSFGFLKAYRMMPDLIITLDDDCYPDDPNFIQSHYGIINKSYPKYWMQHFNGIKVRGMPYELEQMRCVLNIGLWSNIPDLDAQTQLAHKNYRSQAQPFNYPAPLGYFIPMCGMNLAFKPEVVPALYFLLMGRGYEYDRFGDIWAGIFLKKICDHLGVYICGGYPNVRHNRASDPNVNLVKEAPGIKIHEQLWQDINALKIEGGDFKNCYISLAKQLPEYSPYWTKLKGAMQIWANLY